MKFQHIAFLSVSCLALFGLNACSGVKTEAKYPTGMPRGANENDIYTKESSVFGEDGLGIFSSKKSDKEESTGIGVNSYLWRASLDTVSFMPVESADPFGGVILTDWYQPDPSIGERFKVNIYILSRKLESNGVRVRVFKQQKQGGSWVDKPSSDETATQMEDTILTRARQLRVAG